MNSGRLWFAGRNIPKRSGEGRKTGASPLGCGLVSSINNCIGTTKYQYEPQIYKRKAWQFANIEKQQINQAFWKTSMEKLQP